MKQLLIATSNPGKLHEIRHFLADIPLELVGLKDLNIGIQAPETGNTFLENAMMKAKFYANIAHLPTLADDGGLEIDALGGAPGVHSHRWISKDQEDTDEALIEYTIERLQHVSIDKRGAQLHLVLALLLPDGKYYTSEALVRGIIPFEASAKRTAGFPFRSLLYIPEIKKYYDHSELTEAETETYNHRKQAVDQLKPIIKHLC